ncbi:hypothetical protein YC2023_039736 [Brassica napus]
MMLRVRRDHNYLQAHTFLGSLIATRNGKFNCNTQWEVSDWCRDVDHLQTGGILFTIHIFSLFKNQNPKLIALTHGLSPDCVLKVVIQLQVFDLTEVKPIVRYSLAFLQRNEMNVQESAEKGCSLW